MSALDKQEGGGHYKGKAIQPVQYIHANGLGFCEGNVVKYITRWREKGGKADLLKVIHYVELLMELEGLADSSAQVVNMDLNAVFHMPIAWPYGAGEPASKPTLSDHVNNIAVELASNASDTAAHLANELDELDERAGDPWYGAPEWAKYKAQDENGIWCWFDARPVATSSRWVCQQGVGRTWQFAPQYEDHPNPNWRDTLIERPVGQDPQE